MINSYTPRQLKEELDNGITIQVIDVREIHELEICTIKSEHIPMALVMDSHDKIRTDCPVVIYCRTGKRSEAVVHTLQMKFGFKNLFNLEGGIMGWAEEVEPTMERY